MNKEALIFLGIAIVVEVIATTALKSSDSFTRLLPSIISIAGYCIAFWCLTIPMRTIRRELFTPSGLAPGSY